MRTSSSKASKKDSAGRSVVQVSVRPVGISMMPIAVGQAFEIGNIPMSRSETDDELDGFERLSADDMGDIEYLKVLKNAPAGCRNVDPLDMPLDFEIDELFKLDVDSKEDVLQFFRTWGIPCVPYFESRKYFNHPQHLSDRFHALSEIVDADILFARTSRRFGLGTGKADKKILDIMKKEALLPPEDYTHSERAIGQELFRAMKKGAARSERCRVELFDKYDPAVMSCISYEESLIAIKALRECIAYAFAYDIAATDSKARGKGCSGLSEAAAAHIRDLELGRDALEIMHDEFHITPEVLTPHPMRKASKEELNQWMQGGGLSERASRSAINFLNACIMKSGAVSLRRFGSMTAAEGTAEDADAIRIDDAGAETLLALHAMMVLSLSVPWRRCHNEECRNPYYKLPRKKGYTTIRSRLGSKAMPSDFCCPTCQKKQKRREIEYAKEYAIEAIRKNPALLPGGLGASDDGRDMSSSYADLIEEASAYAYRESRGSDERYREDPLLTVDDIMKCVERVQAEKRGEASHPKRKRHARKASNPAD